MRSDDAASPSRRALLKSGVALLLASDAWLAPAAAASALRIGAAAPPATLVTLDGERLSTTELRGQVVLLTFWATWCVPCREELPLLSRYHAEHAAAGLRVLGFALDPAENLPEVRAVARSLSFPVGLLANSAAPGYGRIWKLPVSFTIDRAGRLVTDGWKDRSPVLTSERLDAQVTPLLAIPG
jgi:cytochrome c biogenesis protein CcmG, thiol:disulfide interchange protein DsbE